MLISNFSPVLIPTLNRYYHFKRCVSSLASCNNANNTILYIALDYPLKESHWEGYNLICEYIPNILGFKDVIVIERKVNFGAGKNSVEAFKLLFNKYPSLIFSEDDNIFSYDFLDFVNYGLNTYQNREDIFSISGYQFPISVPENYVHDIYIWPGYSGWGVGMWKEKWEKISWRNSEATLVIKRFLKNYKDIYKYNKIANHLLPAKLLMIEQGIIHGDGYICLFNFLNNMYSVFPVISRVRNLGHDGTGINCGLLGNDIYAKQGIYSGENGELKMPIDIQINKEINNLLSIHFRTPLISKIKTLIKIVLINMGFFPFRFLRKKYPVQ